MIQDERQRIRRGKLRRPPGFRGYSNIQKQLAKSKYFLQNVQEPKPGILRQLGHATWNPPRHPSPGARNRRVDYGGGEW